MSKSVTFRTIAYGVTAVCSGIALLYTSGAMDDIKKTVRIVSSKGEEKINEVKEKREIKKEYASYNSNDIDERIKKAQYNYYVDECFRGGKFN